MTRDLTTGSPIRLILQFAVPTLLGLLFQQLYNLVDTMIVGKLLGAQALAAVGSTGSIYFFVIGVCTGVCSGFAIPVAQRVGAGDLSKMRQYVANAAYLSVLFALVLTVSTGLGCRGILTLMRTPKDIFEGANAYIFVIFMGIPATFLYNLLAGILRSLGDSRTPVVFLVIASFLNIALDLLLIVVIPMGVVGAAVATVLSQLLSGVACFVFIVKKFPALHISRQDLHIDTGYLTRLCSIGIPMGLQFSITAIGSIILQTSVNALGSGIVAAVTAAGRLYSLFACAFDALGVAMSTYGGQNIGSECIGIQNDMVRRSDHHRGVRIPFQKSIGSICNTRGRIPTVRLQQQVFLPELRELFSHQTSEPVSRDHEDILCRNYTRIALVCTAEERLPGLCDFKELLRS